MRKAGLFIMFGLSLTLGACASNPVITKEQSLSKNTEILIGEYGYWKRDCSNRHFDIYIEEYPKGGDLRFEVGSLTIPEKPLVGRSGKCAGKPVKSKRVFYVPSHDYSGEDYVEYVVKSTRLLGSAAYSVNIKVE